MANKIFNKYKEPRYAEFSRKDLVIDIKNGHLYYKSNIGVHRMASELVSDNFGATDTDIVINNVYNVGIPPTFKDDGIRLGDGSISGSLTVDPGNLIVSGSTSGSITSIGPSGSVHINNLGSGSISASGFLFAKLENNSNTGLKTVMYNTSTGKFFTTGSYVGGGGSVTINTVSDTTGQTGIDFTLSAGDLSAVVSGLDTDDDVAFAQVSASGNLFANLPDGFQNVATYNSQSGQLFYTSSAGLSAQLDTFKVTGQRNGDSVITGSLHLSSSTSDLRVDGTVGIGVAAPSATDSNPPTQTVLHIKSNHAGNDPTVLIEGVSATDNATLRLKNADAQWNIQNAGSSYSDAFLIRSESIVGGSYPFAISKTATGIGSTHPLFYLNGTKLSILGHINDTTSTNLLVSGNMTLLGPNGHITASGNIIATDITATGTITAQEFHTEFVSASIIYESGSTKFGDTQDDNHNFTGSLNLSGSVNIQGSGHITASGNISASGDIFARSITVTNLTASIVSASDRVITNNITASGNISASGTGKHFLGGDTFINGDITGSNELLIQKSSGEGTPAFGTSNVAVFQNNDNNQDASIAIISADSKKSQIHFGKHDDIDVGGIRYFHEDHSSTPDEMRFRVGGTNVAAITNVSNRGSIGVGDITVFSPTDFFHAQGGLAGGGITISSSNGAGILLKGTNVTKTIDRSATDKNSFIEFDTAGTTNWTFGNIAESNDNLYIYSGDSTSDKHISLTSDSTMFHTNVTASGAISASGTLNAGLSNTNNANLVFYNTVGGELTYATTSSFLDGLISSSAQIATDISGAIDAATSSLLNSYTFLSSSTQIATDISGAIDAATGSLLNTYTFLSSSTQIATDISGAFTSTSASIATDIAALPTGNAVSGSFLLNTTDTLTGDLTVTNNITASGNISASGNLFANVTDNNDTNFKTVMYDTVTGKFFRTGSYGGGGSADNLGNHTATQDLDLGGNNIKNINHITASGDISGSGKLFRGLTSGLQNNLVFYNSTTGELTQGTTANFTNTAVFANAVSGAFTSTSASLAEDITVNAENISVNTAAISTLNSETLISASELSSPAQGEAQLTINGVAQTAVDLGLQTTDNVTFNNITSNGNIIGDGSTNITNVNNIEAAGFITASGRLIIHDNSNQGSIFHASASNIVTIHNPGPSRNSLHSYGNIQVGNSGQASHITASGNISASGKLFGGLTEQNHTHVVYYDTTTGELTQDTAVKLLDAEGILSGSSQIATDISGAIDAATGSLLNTYTFLSSSAQIASDISGSWQSQDFANLSAADISGSFLLNTTDTLTGDLTVTNDITASHLLLTDADTPSLILKDTTNPEQFKLTQANSQATINISGSSGVANNLAITTDHRTNHVYINGDTGDILLGGHIEVKGGGAGANSAAHITASGNISASGTLNAGLTSTNNSNLVFYNPTTGELTQNPTSSFLSGLISSSTQIATDISGAFTSTSASIATDIATNSASIADLTSATGSFLLNTTDTLDGDLTVTGTITAQEFHTEFVSASIIFESGSTQFGNSSDDVHTFSGSINVKDNGHITASGNISASGNMLTNQIDVDNSVTAGGHVFAGGSVSASLQLYGGLSNTTTDNIVFYNPSGGELTYGSAGDIGGGLLSSSAQIATDISGAFTSTSASIATDIATNSASIADLTSATGSYLLNTTDTLTGDLTVTNNITASGNISASGDVISNKLKVFAENGVEIESPSGGPRIHFGSTTDTDSFMTIGSYGSINNIDTKARDFHLFGTNTTTGFYFDESAGKFGIGTTSPGEKLEVIGNISASGDVKADEVKVAEGNGKRGIYFDNHNYLSPQSHNDDVWIRSDSERFTFQTGDDADNWTYTYQLHLPDPGGASANSKLATLGQRTSNAADGTYRGTRIVKYEGSSVVDGELKVGHITASGNISASGNLFADVTDSSDTNFKTVMYDTATGQFFRTGSYGGGGSGTVTSVTSGNTSTITIGGTAADPTISANTSAVVNGGSNLATGDQIYDFVTGQGYLTSGDNLGNHTATQSLNMSSQHIINANTVGVQNNIQHDGDDDTKIIFSNDQIDFDAGGVTMLTLDEASNDIVTINANGVDVDFRVEGDNVADLIRTDAANNSVGIGIFPTTKFHVTGSTRIDGPVHIDSATNELPFLIESNIDVDSTNNNTFDEYQIAVHNYNGGEDKFAGIAFDAAEQLNSNSSNIGSSIKSVRKFLSNSNHRADLVFSTNGNNTNPTEKLRIKDTGPIILQDGSGTWRTTLTNGGNWFEISPENVGTPSAHNGTKIVGNLFVLDSGYTNSAGNIEADGDVIAFASSDKRLKDNITPISNPIKKILQIGGYTFNWNEKQNTYKGQDVGVIAQEIEKVLPEVVEERKSGYKAVKYEKIVPLLIEAIKDQQKQIDELKKIVDGIR